MKPETDTASSPLGFMERLFWLLGFICEIFLVVMVVLTTVEITLRLALNMSPNLSEEVCGYLLVGVSFFGFGVATLKGQLLRVDFLITRRSPRTQLILNIVFETIALAVSSVVFYQLTRMVISTFSRANVSDTWLQTPLFIPQMAMPVGMAGVIYALAYRIVSGVRQLKQSGQNVD